MEPEVIDWDNIDSVFIEDDTYENFNAPKWVDFSASPAQPVDDDAWFCKPGCKHPKTVEDYVRSKRGSKVKFLKSATISEMLPFRERNRRDAKLKKAEILKSVHSFREDCENKSPNLSNINNLSKKLEIRLSEAEEQRDDDFTCKFNQSKAKDYIFIPEFVRRKGSIESDNRILLRIEGPGKEEND